MNKNSVERIRIVTPCQPGSGRTDKSNFKFKFLGPFIYSSVAESGKSISSELKFP